VRDACDLVAWVVAIPVTYLGLPMRHVGLISDARDPRGMPLVLHSTPHFGGVVETDFERFAKRARGSAYVLGYPGFLSPRDVLARGRAHLGAPYDLWSRNCEHFVYDAHGLPAHSPQLIGWQEVVLSIDPNPWGLSS
jgi:hypothetical protein